MAKTGLINLVFVVDESGSMYDNVNDVIGGFKKTIEEQKAVKDGECVVSLYKFASDVKEVYRGEKLENIKELEYKPGGMTRLFDGVGTAIDNIGKWLDGMKEDEKPSKTLVVIITDGEENSSTEYSGKKVREMIELQEKTYNWSFIFLGNDLTSAKDANTLSTKYTAYTTKSKFYNNYDIVNEGVKLYRMSSTISAAVADKSLDESLTKSVLAMNAEYKADTGLDLTNDISKG